MNPKTVVMSSDERGLEPNATVIASLLAHTKGPVWVRLFTRDTPPLTLDSGRLRLEVVTTPEDLRLEGRVPAHVNAGGTFDRIVAIPYCTDWDRAVVLDYDQLVVGDPTDLFEMDLGHALAAGRMWGRSLGSACREWFGRELPEEWRHCQNYRYFYMGPVMNLRALREAGAYDRFVEFHAVANMEEQIAFHVACSDKVVSYDATLNSVPQWDGVGDNTKILHLTGPTKPWNDRQMLGAPLWRKYETTWEELTCGLWNPQENTRETAGVFERVGHVLESLRRDGRTMRVMEIGGWDFGRAQAILRGMLACGPSRWIKIFRPHVDPLALEQAITRFAGPLEDLAEHVEIADGDPVEVLASGLASGELWEALDAIVLHAPRDPAQLSAEVALAWRALRAGGTLAIVPIQRSPGRVAWERYLRARDLLVDSLLDEVAAVSDRHETVLLKGGQAHPIPECGRSAVGTSRIGNGSGWAVVVVTYGDLGTPHLDLLRAVNPCAQG